MKSIIRYLNMNTDSQTSLLLSQICHFLFPTFLSALISGRQWNETDNESPRMKQSWWEEVSDRGQDEDDLIERNESYQMTRRMRWGNPNLIYKDYSFLLPYSLLLLSILFLVFFYGSTKSSLIYRFLDAIKFSLNT